jgi:hypothetical protein
MGAFHPALLSDNAVTGAMGAFHPGFYNGKGDFTQVEFATNTQRPLARTHPRRGIILYSEKTSTARNPVSSQSKPDDSNARSEAKIKAKRSKRKEGGPQSQIFHCSLLL